MTPEDRRAFERWQQEQRARERAENWLRTPSVETLERWYALPSPPERPRWQITIEDFFRRNITIERRRGLVWGEW